MCQAKTNVQNYTRFQESSVCETACWGPHSPVFRIPLALGTKLCEVPHPTPLLLTTRGTPSARLPRGGPVEQGTRITTRQDSLDAFSKRQASSISHHDPHGSYRCPRALPTSAPKPRLRFLEVISIFLDRAVSTMF